MDKFPNYIKYVRDKYDELVKKNDEMNMKGSFYVEISSMGFPRYHLLLDNI